MLKDIQELSRQIRFAIARAGHARDRGDKKAEAEANAVPGRIDTQSLRQWPSKSLSARLGTLGRHV
jgi:hypothetical protein